MQIPSISARYYIVTLGLSGSTIFFPHYLINGTIFGLKVIEKMVYFDILYNICPEEFIKVLS